MKFEVRIPISPEPHFFREVEYKVRSFAAAGGLAASARFAIFVGADCEPYDIASQQAWSRDRVEWLWVDRERFRQHSFLETSMARLMRETDADIVLLNDADTLLIRGIDDILEIVSQQPVIAGLIAYVPPFWLLRRPELSWETVFADAGRPFPPDRYEHPSAHVIAPAHRLGPAYYNCGVVFAPGAWLLPLGVEMERQTPAVERVRMEQGFKFQLALTFAIHELGLPRVALKLRYNFTNHAWADESWSSDLADVRMIHYMHEEIIGSRRETWGSKESFERLLNRCDLTGSNEVLRHTLADLHAKRALF